MMFAINATLRILLMALIRIWQDATMVTSVLDWVLAEFIRLYHKRQRK